MRKKANLGSIADWMAIAIALATFIADRIVDMPDWYVYLMGVFLLVALAAITRVVLRLLRGGEETEARFEISAYGDGSGNVTGHAVDLDHSVVGPGGTVVHVEIAQPPAKPPSPTLRTLAAPVADFTGRDAEIAELTAALKPDGACDSALISGLRGMGGIGKTELARKVGHLLAADYPDAQLEIACQIGETPESSEQLLAHVLRHFYPGAKLPDALSELQALYRDTLAGKRGFLLLDNAAHADQVRPLLPPPAGWAVVVNSRRRFALPGACLDKNLDVLAERDARDLVRRILQAGGRAATDDQVAKIAELCGRLPLALRIAAAFLVEKTAWGVEEYIGALETERLKYLDVEGEVSVLASLGLSVGQLERNAPDLARRWRLLGVFPAPFDRPAAAAVWECADDEARDALSELCRWSLVEHNEERGTFALHDLLREYALRQGADAVPEGEWDAARRRHAAHYLAVGSAADDLYKTHAVEGLRQFDAALPHLLAAWAWMVDAFRAGQSGRGGFGTRPHDWDVARWLSDFAGRMPNVLDLRLPPREKIAVLEAALGAARDLKDRRDEGIHLGNLGNAYAALGEVRRAIGFYEQALGIDREIGDRRGEGNSLGNLGNAYADLGDPKRAIGLYEQRLAIAREIGDRRGEGNALGNLGLAYADLGDPKRAIGFYEQALEIMKDIGDRRAQGSILGNLGLAYADLGDPKRAIGFYEQHLAIAREIGDRRGEGNALGNLGNAYAALGEVRRAIGLYEQRLAIAREIGDRRGEANACWNMGLAYEKLGDYARAADLMRVCVDYERAIGHPDAEKAAARLAQVRAKAR